MKHYWQYRFDRDRKLGRRYCEPDRTEKEYQSKVIDVKNKINNFLEGKQFFNVLDFGCGTGFLHDAFRNANYTGVDIIPELIYENNKKHGNKFRLIDDAWEATPYYALIFSKGVFQHLQDQEVLKRLMEFKYKCSNLIIFSPPGSVNADIKLEGDAAGAPTCRHPYQLEKMIKDCGYTIKKSEGDSCFIWAIPKEEKPL